MDGRIIAYRPLEQALQAPSFVTNTQSFLLSVSTAHPRLVRLVYEHTGYGQLSQEALANGPVVRVRSHRDESCDETFAAFVEHSSASRGEASGAEGGITLDLRALTFVADGMAPKPSGGELLKCYRVQQDALVIVGPPR